MHNTAIKENGLSVVALSLWISLEKVCWVPPLYSLRCLLKHFLKNGPCHSVLPIDFNLMLVLLLKNDWLPFPATVELCFCTFVLAVVFMILDIVSSCLYICDALLI